MPVDEKTVNDIFVSNYNEFKFVFDKKVKFRTFKSFQNFVSTEVEYWLRFDKGQFAYIKNLYNKVSIELSGLQKDCDESKIQMTFHNVHNSTDNSPYFIKSSSQLAQLLSRLYNQDFNVANAALIFLTSKDNNNTFSQKFPLLGAMNAFNFLKSLETDNVEADFASERMDKIAAKHIEEIHKIKDSYFDLENSFKEELVKGKQDLNNCNAQFSEQLNTQKNINEQELNFWKSKFTELEILYREDLRLKAPAEYWKELKEEYNKKGKNWIIASISVGIIFVNFLLSVFYFFPEWLKGSITSDHLKGLIIFTLLVSVFTYLLHLFSKLSISAYHLSRDANKRYQLTHVYLALLNERIIEPSEREIILQALFSRADTGLIKNDGAPTMPGASSIIDSAIKTIGRR